MAATAQEARTVGIKLHGICSWTSLWSFGTVKLDGVRSGSSPDFKRALMGLGLMVLLFGALYYNQAYRDWSFGWLSRTIASSASAALDARLAAARKPALVYIAPAPALISFSGRDNPAPNRTDSTIRSSTRPELNLVTANNTSDTRAVQNMEGAAPPEKYFKRSASNATILSVNETGKAVTEVAPQSVAASADKPLILTGYISTSMERSEDPTLEDKHLKARSPALSPEQSKDSTIHLHRSPEESNWRLNLEHALRDAKQAIAMAPQVLDAELHPPLYKNVSAFKMSYETMERVFKVYVYEEGEKPLIRDGPLTGIYSSEGHFIKRMVDRNQFTVKDHTRAHIFFLPYSVANMVDKLYVPDSYTMQPINEYIRDYVNMLAAKYPFWNETQGTDHFFVSCHDWGLMTTFNHKELNKNAIKVLCNADAAEGFIPERDASLPEMYLHSLRLPHRLGGPGPQRRPILAFFAGQMHGRVRPILLDHWKDKDEDMKIYEVLPLNVSKKMSYVRHMKSSKYCICAMGYEVNSPRIVEAIYYDCVPVIIADNFVLPFSDVLDWDAFSLTVAEIDIPNLKKILLDVPEQKYQEMQKRLKIVRQHFVWHEEVVRYDVFHMILHSVWLKRLGQVLS